MFVFYYFHSEVGRSVSFALVSRLRAVRSHTLENAGIQVIGTWGDFCLVLLIPFLQQWNDDCFFYKEELLSEWKECKAGHPL